MAAHKNRNFLTIFFDILEITIISATIFLLVYLFVGQLLEVTGDSMDPTLLDKEQVLAEKLSIRFNPIDRGDIVIFKHPEQNDRLLIKRVIGLPFDIVKISTGRVYINGHMLDEYYLDSGALTYANKSMLEGVEYAVPESSYILIGDNRDKSSDSRSFGPIRRELIVGKAAFVYYPFSSFRMIEH